MTGTTVRWLVASVVFGFAGSAWAQPSADDVTRCEARASVSACERAARAAESAPIPDQGAAAYYRGIADEVREYRRQNPPPDTRSSDGDDCDGALDAEVGRTTGSTAGMDADYVAGCTWESGPDVVHEFEPDRDAVYCAMTDGSAFDTVLHVRTACDIDASELACNDDGGAGLTSRVEFFGNRGSEYYIIVDGWGAEAAGDYTLEIAEGPCPEDPDASPAWEPEPELPPRTGPGDWSQRCTPAAGPVGFGDYTGSTVGADHVTTGCVEASGPEMLVRFEPDRTGTVCADTFGSSFDTVLAVRTSCDASGTELACNDDTDGLDSQIEFYAQQGGSYFIHIDGFFQDSRGDFALNIQPGPCGSSGTTTPDYGGGTEGGGTRGAGDPAGACPATVRRMNFGTAVGTTPDSPSNHQGTCGGMSGEAMIEFLSPMNGSICVDAGDSDFDTLVYVRSDCDDATSELACNDDAVGLTSRLEFIAQQNRTYYVFVDGYGGVGGSFSVDISPGPCR